MARLLDVCFVAVGVVAAACSGSTTPAPAAQRPVRDAPVTPSEQQTKDIVPPSAQAADACDDAPLVTLDELAQGKGAGERIAIDGVPAPRVICTGVLCVGPDGSDGCCNGCGGGYQIVDRAPGVEPWLEVFLDGLAGCRGGACNVWCEPFGSKPATAYRFVGVNTFKPAGTGAVYHKSMFQIEKYCRL